jgi:hypothetical protein
MSRYFSELSLTFLLLFNSAVRPAETGERSCRGDFPDESLGLHSIARIALFRDEFLVQQHPELAVRSRRSGRP